MPPMANITNKVIKIPSLLAIMIKRICIAIMNSVSYHDLNARNDTRVDVDTCMNITKLNSILRTTKRLTK